MKKLKLLYLLPLLLFMVACSGINLNDVDNKQNKENDNTKQNFIEGEKFSRTPEKDLLYYELYKEIYYIYYESSEEYADYLSIDEIFRNDTIYESSLEHSYYYYEVLHSIKKLEKINQDNLNENEKILYNVLLNYKKKMITYLVYIEPFYNEDNFLDLPEHEIDTYNKQIRGLNRPLLNHEDLILKTVKTYYSEEADYMLDSENLFTYLLDEYEKGFDAYENKKYGNEDELFNEFPRFIITLGNDELLWSLLNKDKEYALDLINTVSLYVDVEKETGVYEEIPLLESHVEDMNSLFKNKDFIDVIEQNEFEDALFMLLEVDNFMNIKYVSKPNELAENYYDTIEIGINALKY